MTSEAENWTDLGALDPKWAIASRDDKRGGRWADPDFFGGGEQLVAGHLDRVDRASLTIRTGAALDFGCGIGRLTRALAPRFKTVVGVDVSTTMVEQARQNVPDATFLVETDPGLPGVPKDSFDLILAHHVLQHAGPPETVRRYIGSLAAKLAPGGVLVFNLPVYIPWRHRLQPRRRLYALGRAAGLPPAMLFKAGLSPIRMTALPRETILSALTGCRIVAEEPKRYPSGLHGVIFVATRPQAPSAGGG